MTRTIECNPDIFCYKLRSTLIYRNNGHRLVNGMQSFF